MAKLPLDSALKSATGKLSWWNLWIPTVTTAVRHISFSQRKDVTLNILFFPLSKESAGKIKHILCSKMY